MPNCKTVVPYRGHAGAGGAAAAGDRSSTRDSPGPPCRCSRPPRRSSATCRRRSRSWWPRGWISPCREVYGVASFYAQFTLNPKGKYQICRLSGHRLLRQGRRRTCWSAVEQKLGIAPRRHHAGREVLPGRLPLHRRLRPGPGHDDQQRCVRPPDPRRRWAASWINTSKAPGGEAMKELSLHLLDIAQNSIAAGATPCGPDAGGGRGADSPSPSPMTACGMSPEFLAQVTDPFTTTRTTRKVGLGLPLLPHGGGADRRRPGHREHARAWAPPSPPSFTPGTSTARPWGTWRAPWPCWSRARRSWS